MNRFEYLDALRDALFGLPEAAVASIVADYERRFAERSLAGQSEEEIMASLGDPKQIAAEKRATLQLNAFKEKKSVGNLVRLFFSLIGLFIFNLFMLVPSIIYLTLLLVAFVVSLVVYGAGIVVTAASLAGVSGLPMDDPFDHARIEHHASALDKYKGGGPTSIDIGNKGILIQSQPQVAAAGTNTSASTNAAASAAASANAGDKNALHPNNKVAASAVAAKGAASAKDSASGAKNTASAGKDVALVTGDVISKQNDTEWNDNRDHDVDIEIGNNGVHIGNADIDDAGVRVGNLHIDDSGVRFIHAHGEDVPRFITFGNDFLSESRPAQVGIGISMVFSGIILFLLCLVVAKLTWIGICRLAQMEFSVLKNA
jgi:uncharacterized membrane protein